MLIAGGVILNVVVQAVVTPSIPVTILQDGVLPGVGPEGRAAVQGGQLWCWSLLLRGRHADRDW